jgi:hypothetical protein
LFGALCKYSLTFEVHVLKEQVMNGHGVRVGTRVVEIVLVASLVFATCLVGQVAAQPVAEQLARLELARAEGTEASVTVFPVAIVVANRGEKAVADIGKDAGKVLALLLEQAGMVDLAIADSVFTSAPDEEFEAVAAQFGAFVRAGSIATDYALYAEIVARAGGKPQFEEVRSALVTKDGEAVWVDRLTAGDAEFQRAKPTCPMSCCVLLADRVRTTLGIPDSARDESGEGKIAQMLAKDSPGPDKAEWAAIEQRRAVMKDAAGDATLAVFPVRLSDDEVGSEDAMHLANLLGDQSLCEAESVASSLRVKIQPSHNEQELLWALARAFRDHVRQNPPEADYALLADYLISPRGQHVRAVHFVVCDRDGEWVIVDFQNDHHADFHSIDPKTREDCGRLVAQRLEQYLR